MLELKRVTRTFPSVSIASQSGGLPVEVALITQLGHGAGDHIYQGAIARQQAHTEFVDELEEPSAKLAGTDFTKGDATSLYSFAVGPNGHPFHRHAGHRVFTAISGSGGAQLRFSTASPQEIAAHPQHFFDCLHFVNIPPDCLFTVRFGGETWHQFWPLAHNKLHPTFFALSCHTDELGGNLSPELRQQVLANQATIPALTELLPTTVMALLEQTPLERRTVNTTALSLDAPPGSLQALLCQAARCSTGLLRGAWGRWRGAQGYLADNRPRPQVMALGQPPHGSLLLTQLQAHTLHHEDTFCLVLVDRNLVRLGPAALLSKLLQGFLDNPPAGVGRMMALRNVLVRPMGLRTSPLGCPVSSLLSKDCSLLFDQRFPVLDQAVSSNQAQVVLGADDKHLLFRSCVGVSIIGDDQVCFTLGTRVHCKNLFGRFYMAAINRVHRSYITPTMLQLAVEHLSGMPDQFIAPLPLQTQS
ncbi:DUF2867 domain-containing protein [Chitinolyticbacter albus]|uniref:DUF2867 domain-containing protein n=1 Tax=Chitinolyticbacter albus TaxID=2961951 RepID=UPI00210A27D1|nr:DUF2867 domain-containing protein [Chitinolyticbacter albus]